MKNEPIKNILLYTIYLQILSKARVNVNRADTNVPSYVRTPQYFLVYLINNYRSLLVTKVGSSGTLFG